LPLAVDASIPDLAGTPASGVFGIYRIDGGEKLVGEPAGVATQADAVVIITDHTCFDYEGLVNGAKLIVDTRNALKHFTEPNIQRL
jgi:hypothetical protein